VANGEIDDDGAAEATTDADALADADEALATTLEPTGGGAVDRREGHPKTSPPATTSAPTPHARFTAAPLRCEKL